MTTKIHPFKELLSILLMALGLTMVSSFLILILSNAFPSLAMQRSVQVISQVVGFALPMLFAALLFHRGEERDFYRLDFSRLHWLQGLIGVVAILLLSPSIDFLTTWNDGFHLPEPLEGAMRKMQAQSEGMLQGFMQGAGWDTLVANLLVVALTAAVCEEVFFRGGVQRLLEKWIPNVHVAVWVSAMFFSLMHFEVYAFVPRVVLGAVLGYLYHYTHSLLPGMIVHFANNAFVVVLYWLNARGFDGLLADEPLAAPLWVVLLTAVAAVCVMWYVMVVMERKSLKH